MRSEVEFTDASRNVIVGSSVECRLVAHRAGKICQLRGTIAQYVTFWIVPWVGGGSLYFVV